MPLSVLCYFFIIIKEEEISKRVTKQRVEGGGRKEGMRIMENRDTDYDFGRSCRCLLGLADVK